MAGKNSTNATTSDEYDTSELLMKDTGPLREVNETFWWCYDAVCLYAVTYLTHSTEDITQLGRLYITAGLLVLEYIMCKLYFTAGLDRPSSGQAMIDKWWHMAIVHFGCAMFVWQWFFSLYTLYTNWITEGISALTMTLNTVFGFVLVFFMCDVLAGFVHWFGDSTDMYFFQYHHKDSRYMTRHSYVHHTWETYALAIVLSMFIPAFNTHPIWTSVKFIASQANECHMWSHCLSHEIPPFIKLLQDCTLVLSWKAHKTHHRPPYLIDYCVFNGWANPIMNKILPGPLTNAANKLRDSAGFQWLKKTLDT